ncbi:hypothetical protein [uncultured Methylobacterium sp.]|uniref:hypothetical protein n=1 Tax=uncultured Methylobacterium sp. TaxID=157278 RepID=UPI0025956870|nr:hypothetical protein [uncultured Methylobacterium sp.]
MNNDTPAPAPTDQDLSEDTGALEALREGLRGYFSALGPDEGAAFDALLAEGGL